MILLYWLSLTQYSFNIHNPFDSEFAPHCRLLSSSVTPHPSTPLAFILMSSRKGPRGGGPMAGPPPGPSSCLFPASGCWPLALSGGFFSLICHLGPNITETTPSRPGLHEQWLVLLPLEGLAVYFSLSYSNRFTKSVNILLCEVRGTISKCLMGNGSDPRSLGAV